MVVWLLSCGCVVEWRFLCVGGDEVGVRNGFEEK